MREKESRHCRVECSVSRGFRRSRFLTILFTCASCCSVSFVLPASGTSIKAATQHFLWYQSSSTFAASKVTKIFLISSKMKCAALFAILSLCLVQFSLAMPHEGGAGGGLFGGWGGGGKKDKNQPQQIILQPVVQQQVVQRVPVQAVETVKVKKAAITNFERF